MNVTSISRVLQQHGIRATYGAIAGVVGASARSVMRGYARCPLYSWIVSKRYGVPTGYDAGECDPRLLENAEVLRTPEDLAAFLRANMAA